MVKLLKFLNSKWRVVDYGVLGKVDVYIAMGYIVMY